MILQNIYQTALDEKFHSIMEVIAKELGYGPALNGLTVESGVLVRNLAEQSVIDWAVARRSQYPLRPPITNLQHLLDEYCALADHL